MGRVGSGRVTSFALILGRVGSGHKKPISDLSEFCSSSSSSSENAILDEDSHDKYSLIALRGINKRYLQKV